jgi:UDP-N-acetyl-D-galactosamine dehydrogenase
VVDIIEELNDYGVEVLVNDPLADADEAREHYGIELLPLDALKGVDAAVVAVIHSHYAALGLDGVAELCTNGTPIVTDVKSAFDPEQAKRMDIVYWQL